MKQQKKCRAEGCKNDCKGAEVFCCVECFMKNQKAKAEEFRKHNDV